MITLKELSKHKLSTKDTLYFNGRYYVAKPVKEYTKGLVDVTLKSNEAGQLVLEHGSGCIRFNPVSTIEGDLTEVTYLPLIKKYKSMWNEVTKSFYEKDVTKPVVGKVFKIKEQESQAA